MSCCASGADPADTTVPAPSFPAVRAFPTRAASEARARCGICAVMIGRSVVPENWAASTSAPARRTPRSDGFIGVASTLTITSCDPGSGIAASTMGQLEAALMRHFCLQFQVHLFAPVLEWARPRGFARRVGGFRLLREAFNRAAESFGSSTARARIRAPTIALVWNNAASSLPWAPASSASFAMRRSPSRS